MILRRFIQNESGATAIEYGLLAGILGVGLIVGYTNVKDGVFGLYTNLKTELTAR
jgi:pilus assembly protein Flp/PilA